MDETPTTGPSRPAGDTERSRPLWRALFALLGWIARHVRGFYAAVGVFLLIGLALALGTIAAFAGVAELVAEGDTQALDERILLWVHARGSPFLDEAALEVTTLGSAVVVLLVVVVASIFLWSTRHRFSVALLWIAMVGEAVINLALKAFFGRPRPELFEWGSQYTGGSAFPSGHAMTAAAVYSTLAYLTARLEPGPALRRATLGFFALLILLIGASRIYLGVHYPSDVVGGILAGIGWAACCVLGLEAVRYFRAREPAAGAQEKDLERGALPAPESRPEEDPLSRADPQH